MLATVPLPGCWVRTRTPSSACSRSRAGRCASAAVEPAPGCRHYLRWPHVRMSCYPIIFLLGGERGNMVAVTIALWLLMVERRLNHPAILVMLTYFSWKSVGFVR